MATGFLSIRIVVKTFGGNPTCGTLPKPTVINTAVDDAQLAWLDRAIEKANEKLMHGADVVLQDGPQAACLDPQRKPGRLPELSRDEIKSRLAQMLQRFGDLAEYLDGADEGATIFIKTFTHKHSCATLPVPNVLNAPVGKDRFVPLENAIHTINKALSSNAKVVFKGRRAKCLDAAKH